MSGNTATRSYASGTSTVPLLGDTIPTNLARTAAAHADREALVEVASGRRFTYRQLADEVDAVARGFYARGIAAGDRLGTGPRTRPSGCSCSTPRRASERSS